jgi:hypothetical protein
MRPSVEGKKNEPPPVFDDEGLPMEMVYAIASKASDQSFQLLDRDASGIDQRHPMRPGHVRR